MPRGRLGQRARRNASEALRFEQLCHQTRERRRTLREAQRMEDMRRKTYGWDDLKYQIEGLEIQAEMQAMELRLTTDDRSRMGLPARTDTRHKGELDPLRRPEFDWRNYE